MGEQNQGPRNGTSAPGMPSGLLYADIMGGAWRRKWHVVFGLLLGLAAGAIYWPHWTRIYESEVQLLVVKKKVPESRVAGVNPQFPELEDYLSAQKALLSSPLIVGKAVEDGELQRLKSLEQENDPTTAIIENLTVTPDSADRSGHSLLTLTYRGTVPEDCKRVLEAIVATYKAYLADTQTGVAVEVEGMFTQWRDEVQESITQKQHAYRTLREATPAALWTGKDGVNLSESRLVQLEVEKLLQTVRRTELQGRLAALEQAKEAGASQEELVQMITHWSDLWRPPAEKAAEIAQRIDAKLHEQLLLLQLKEQALPESYGPAHPQVRAIREQVRLAELALGRYGSEEAPAAPTTDTAIDVLPADPVKTYFTSLQKDLQIATELEQTISDLTREEQQRARQINDLNEDMEALRSEIASAEQLQQQIAQQLQSLGVLQASDLYHAQVISPAVVGRLVFPQPWLVFPVAALLGILAGAVVAYGAEAADESFRTPGEIRERLRLPVIGHTDYCSTPNRSKRKAGREGRRLASVLCTYFLPDSAESEAYRRVRWILSHGRNGGPRSIIQITSPNAGDGKSTLAANLAVCMAQAGRSVVLVDGDFRRPCQHALFGVSRKIGIMSVLARQAELSDALQSTSVENLSVLPCERASARSTELLSLDTFHKLLEELRGRFDAVLIDTPPVLGVNDACAVAHHADAVVLTLRNTRRVRPAAEQAVQTLTDQEARLLGIVVNNPTRNGGRYHGYAIRQYQYR